jgi:hypothetical protein
MWRPIVIRLIRGLEAGLLVFLLSFLGSCLRPAKETVLIPDNFEGDFRIVYGEKCGLNPKMENGRRVLEIPQNGLLIIQPAIETGIIDRQYYILDSDFNRARINQLGDYKEGKTKAPGVLMRGSGTMGGAMRAGGLSNESPLAIHFTDFTIFNQDTTTMAEKERNKVHQRLDSATKVLVEACRKRVGGR